MTDTTNTDLAQALRDAIDDLERVAHEDNSCCDPDVDIQRYRAVLALHDTARAQPDRGLLTGTHPDGRPYTLHGTPESVEAVSDLIEARAQPASVAVTDAMVEKAYKRIAMRFVRHGRLWSRYSAKAKGANQ